MSKHPIVPGTDLTTIRSLLLKHETRQARSLLATAIEHLKIPAEEADVFLRRLAVAGYLKWHSQYGGSLDWDLSEHGLRLVADDLGPRLSRQKAEVIIEEVINRARRINSDPDRIARVKELRLFGSVLELDREDFGDVDIEAEIEIRKVPKDEVARARAKIATKVPPSWRQHLIRRVFAEEGYDSRNVFGALKKGIRGLSLSQDATKSLGCEFRRIYSFDVQSGNELEPDRAIVPRTAPPPKTATEITPVPIPNHTVIRPNGLAGADEKIRTEKVRVSMEDLALTEAVVWLGEEGPNGSRVATDTRRNPPQRFAGAQFLFDDWRDPNLTGLELFQRSLDWASLYDLPISRIGRKFTLRTYQATRIANFHALIVKRVADRIEAPLAINKHEGHKAEWYQLGGSTFTTPRMIAAHHSIAAALARMLDETQLTGQVNFTAEFDLSGERRNFYPALPDLSDTSRRLRTSLSKVAFTEEVLEETRRRKHEYDSNLPLHREMRVAAFYHRQKTPEVVALAHASFIEEWKVDDDAESESPGEFLSGEESAWDTADIVKERLKGSVGELPGCLSLSISHRAPVRA